MSFASIVVPEKLRVLVVDDEPDVFTVTRLGLKSMRFDGRRLELLQAATGREAVERMAADPDVAVILLDVVMETDTAGLDACRAIREDLGNHLVRILLRTGQPGQAPEKETIVSYDIDGYLPKTELSTTRLFSSVRTALKAWMELVELERHRRSLAAVHDCVVGFHSFDDLEVTLGKILDAALTIAPATLGVLRLETFAESGDPRTYELSAATDPAAAGRADAVVARVAGDAAARALVAPGAIEGGTLVPLVLHRDLGTGWIFLEGAAPDDLGARALPLLAAHAANTLYSSVAQQILKDREGPLFDSMPI